MANYGMTFVEISYDSTAVVQESSIDVTLTQGATVLDAVIGGVFQTGYTGTIVVNGTGFDVSIATHPDLDPGLWIVGISAQTLAGIPYVGAYSFSVFQPLAVVSIIQTTLNTVETVFDAEPVHVDPLDPVSATNPVNWSVTVTGAPAGSPVRLIQAIEYVGDNTIRVSFDGPLIPTAIYTIELSGVEGVDGEVLFPTPVSETFVAYDKERGATEPLLSNAQSYDLANPQTPTTAGSDQSLGTLQVTDEGDLENDTGRAALKKRILRRVSTVPGGFAHLPTYGVDLQEGKLIRSTDLRRIQINVEKQVREEPGVVSVRVSIAQPSPGIIRLRIRVRDSEGLFEMTEAVDTTEAL